MSVDAGPSRARFVHAALVYDGDEEFLAATVPFVEAGLKADEPVMVAMPDARNDVLRSALGAGADDVRFEDMSDLGRNPARIIPAWRDFLGTYPAGTPARGIGEPIWDGRSDAELVECQRHEALLNLAFADAEAFTLLCPYDVRLGERVLDEARCSHPVVVDGGVERDSPHYCGEDAISSPFDAPLPPAPPRAEHGSFDMDRLPELRRWVRRQSAGAGLSPARTSDLVLAVDEVATNSVRHGGGGGALAIWREPGSLVCELRDRGRIDDPLAGREPPDARHPGGWGLWIASQLCDLVQIRAVPDGSVVRLHMRAG